VIDGSDCTGKTTLAKRCVELLNARGFPHVYHHLSRLPRCWERQAPMNYERLISPWVVQDRFHVSNPVYAAVEPRKPEITQAEYALVEATLRLRGAYVVIVTAEPALIERRFVAEREMYSLRQVLQVNEWFRSIAVTGDFHGFETHADQVIHCDESDEWPSDKAEEIVESYLGRLQRVISYPGASAERVPVGAA
jgi:thymidylate kinase